VYIDYDVLELIRDFLNFGSKDKNITVTLRNFKKAYKMEDAVHVHSEKEESDNERQYKKDEAMVTQK
jgi:hypothetical protein